MATGWMRALQPGAIVVAVALSLSLSGCTVASPEVDESSFAATSEGKAKPAPSKEEAKDDQLFETSGRLGTPLISPSNIEVTVAQPVPVKITQDVPPQTVPMRFAITIRNAGTFPIEPSFRTNLESSQETVQQIDDPKAKGTPSPEDPKIVFVPTMKPGETWETSVIYAVKDDAELSFDLKLTSYTNTLNLTFLGSAPSAEATSKAK